MNRISRRPAAEADEALLELGRTQPALDYDVELGLERHHHWLRSDAPMPEWASAGATTATKSLLPIAIKTLVSAVLIGGLAVTAWQARGGQQPSAAGVDRPSSASEHTDPVAPSVRDVPAPESASWLATTPIPVPDHDRPRDEPVRRVVRADTPDKRTTRSQRAAKESAVTRSASTRAQSAVPRTEQADATAARVEPALPANPPPSADVSLEPATRSEVAASPERKPSRATHEARPEPGPRAQEPDDLAEMQQVATAEQLLQRSPQRALALVRQGDQHFARGYFQQERAYIAIMALIRLGRIDEARARAATFAKQFPPLPYGARIRSALEARETDTSRNAAP